MKRPILTLFFAIYILCNSFSQSSEAFRYQSIVRDLSGNPVSSKILDFRISIISGTTDGAILYVETHSGQTNEYGLIHLKIGTGNLISGNFSSIDWAANDHFLKVQIDTEGQGNYSIESVNQMLSVPYSLHAKKADTADYSGISEYAMKLFSLEEDICTPQTEGSLRYNYEDRTVMLCDGDNWVVVGSSPPVKQATVITPDILDISSQGVSIGLEVVYNGGDYIREHGICWNESGNPVLDDDHVNFDYSPENLYTEITSMNANTRYIARAYAINRAGAGYGNEQVFTTLASVETNQFTVLDDSSFRIGGAIHPGGGEEISERGIVYGYNPTPDKNDYYKVSGAGQGTFSEVFSGLDLIPDTIYLRAYAINPGGTSYGEAVMVVQSLLGMTLERRIEGEHLVKEAGGGKITWKDGVTTSGSLVDPKIFNNYNAENDSIIIVEFGNYYNGEFMLEFYLPNLYPQRYRLELGSQSRPSGVFEFLIQDEPVGEFDLFRLRNAIQSVTGEFFIPNFGFNRVDFLVNNITEQGPVKVGIRYIQRGGASQNGILIDYISLIPY